MSLLLMLLRSQAPLHFRVLPLLLPRSLDRPALLLLAKALSSPSPALPLEQPTLGDVSADVVAVSLAAASGIGVGGSGMPQGPDTV
jgi:hypothetical protein